MYIVWRKRPVKGKGGGPFLLGDPEFRNSDCAPAWHGLRCEHHGTGRIAHTALVVVSERKDGKPRQSVLFRFPTIRSCCAADAFAGAAWWHDVTFSMDTWGEWAYQDLKSDRLVTDLSRDRAAMVKKLREVVPRPHPAMVKTFERFVEEAKRDQRAAFDEAYRRFAEESERLRAETDRLRDEQERRWQAAFGTLFGTDTSDDFATLGLATSVTEAEVKVRFRELAKVHHPDKGGDPAEFRRLREAHDRIIKARSA